MTQRQENNEQMEVWYSGKVRLQAELLERDRGVIILLKVQGKASYEAKRNNLKVVNGRDSIAYCQGRDLPGLGQRSLARLL